MSRLIFAANIKFLRNEKGLTRPEMAEELGIGTKRLEAWEGAMAYPKISMLIKLCDYFGTKDIYNLLTTPIE